MNSFYSLAHSYVLYGMSLLVVTQEEPLAKCSHIGLLHLEALRNETDTSSVFILHSCFNYTHCLL